MKLEMMRNKTMKYLKIILGIKIHHFLVKDCIKPIKLKISN